MSIEDFVHNLEHATTKNKLNFEKPGSILKCYEYQFSTLKLMKTGV